MFTHFVRTEPHGTYPRDVTSSWPDQQRTVVQSQKAMTPAKMPPCCPLPAKKDDTSDKTGEGTAEG